MLTSLTHRTAEMLMSRTELNIYLVAAIAVTLYMWWSNVTY